MHKNMVEKKIESEIKNLKSEVEVLRQLVRGVNRKLYIQEDKIAVLESAVNRI